MLRSETKVEGRVPFGFLLPFQNTEGEREREKVQRVRSRRKRKCEFAFACGFWTVKPRRYI